MPRGGGKPKWVDDQQSLAVIIEVFKRNGMNVSTSARELGIPRQTMQGRIRAAIELGIIELSLDERVATPATNEIKDARLRKIEAFQKKQRRGSWDKPVMVTLPSRPFRLKLFGDPHMDADAFDILLWEKHWYDLDAENGVYGVCIGDWFNNWLKALAHLWKHEGDPDDAWLMFEHYMLERGDALVAACSGNHDDWTHGPADPVDLVMKRHGVVYRKGAVRILLNFNEHPPVTVALRHKWRGHSMYSPAHGLRRAAAEGWDDTIMVGGHTHQDEDRTYVQPRTKTVSHLFQLSAFKKFDDYADVHGFKPHATSPIRDLVIDPSRDDTDPDKVMVFYDSDAAANHLAWLRSKSNAT